MNILRKIGSGIVFVLAVVGALAALGGVAGVWLARAWADQAVLDATTLVGGFVELAGESVAGLDQRLADAEQTVANVQAGIAGLRDGELSPAEEALRRTVIADLQPRVERLQAAAARLSATLAAINRSIEPLNRVPFVNLPTVGSGLDELQSTVADAAARARELAEAARSLDGSRMLAASERLSSRLGDARAALVRVQSFAAATRTALENLRAALSFWLSVAAWALTPLLLLFLAGQVSLAAHAWGWMRAEGRRPPALSRGSTTGR